MKNRIYIVDAFTSKQFSGNQAAVVPLDAWPTRELMQAVASENNLAETAFYVRDGHGVHDIRWFSPLKEIDFCGHATLASAYVVFREAPQLHSVTFRAPAVGEITVERTADGLIEMCFPDLAPVEVSLPPAPLQQGLSIPPERYLKNRQAYFAIYKTEDEVRAVVPDLEKLKELAPLDVVVSAPGRQHDFVSRYFWPANGGAEDPVTGSIHAGLAPYWSRVLDKNPLVALQASARTGTLYCRLEGGNVYVSGHCADYLEGVITLE